MKFGVRKRPLVQNTVCAVFSDLLGCLSTSFCNCISLVNHLSNPSQCGKKNSGLLVSM